ncbi:hypothetical protein [Deinococcus ruber]|uniref:DUF4139 domain-containing protein n=1 Tax=Deinococcus ruber TaxID=1848197 RepID=A0A918C1N0_9DEIO|nr:hypothetical protein [Deinococcus ruber]GGR01140.1 hypothetical protein GCM10008957_12580 [Deinococcus ruber]
MKSALIALTAAALLGTARAADLRIYSSFSEVREGVTATSQNFTLTLPQDVWQNMIPGTLDLDGLSFTSAVQAQQDNWLKSLEGQQVTLREDGHETLVTLVRASDLLIKDASGHYRNVSYSQLSFSVLPPKNPTSSSQSVTYALNKAGSGTLSYLTRGVTWAPRYTLKASGSSAVLSALADIHNNTAQDYNVSATELFAGDVDIQGGAQPYARADVAMTAAAPAPMMGKVGTLGTINGLYRYGLDTAYTLQANSTITLPFLTPALTSFERYAALDTYFNTQGSSGVLNRSYRLKADQNLPGGQLTVREDGRISGQTTLDETAKGEAVEFTLGRDPDVRYTRSVQTVTTTKNGGTYKVTYTFDSSKDRAVRAEVTERVGARKVVLDGVSTANQGVAALRVDIPAKGKATKTFTVTIDNTGN